MTGSARSSVRWLPLLALVSLVAPRAGALEAWDGRIQLHGFAEMQVRGISEDFSDQLDLTQWYNILNLELEADLLEEPVGPVDLVSLFVRGEVRYDCVWTRACGLFPSANAFGDRAKDLPNRLSDAVDHDTAGAIDLVTTRRRSGNRGRPVPLALVNEFDTLAILNRQAFDYVFQNNLEFRYTQLARRGGEDLSVGGTRRLGPWLPKNFVNPNADIADRVNPFDNALVFPVTGQPGAGALPYRPIPVAAPGGRAAAYPTARGIYIPSPALRRTVLEGDLDRFDFNFRQAERAWNRGASQQQTKELKELYFDIEMFDSRLWARVGRQNIVWGKTELFRTTDNFNPVDLALASLPTLEEQRIPLWAGRFVWSFYEVGPLSDVRAEFAFNFDEFQGNDLGACGEPYTPNPVCELTFGAVGHGLTGDGVVGMDEPSAPWKDLKGLEIGGRIEWRWQRFSFALSDFWGYDDTPTLSKIGFYERNVDPLTGRPRAYGTRGPCGTVQVGTTLAPVGNDCLQPGPTFRQAAGGTDPGPPNPGANIGFTESQATVANNALNFHPANQQIFAMICGTSIGFNALDPTACAQNIFGSRANPFGVAPIGALLSGVLAGNAAANGLLAFGTGQIGLPVVAINNDGGAAAREVVAGAPLGSPEGTSFFLAPFGLPTLSAQLTPEQEALLGCGPFFGTNCDDDGIDLLNAEASTLLQSFVGFEGTGPSDSYKIPLAAGPGAPVGAPQPGHVGFVGGPVCTTGDIRNDGLNDRLPGCRDVGGPGYAVNVDGGVANIGFLPSAQTPVLNAFLPFVGVGQQNPMHGQTFSSEMAAVSWNFLMLLVSQSPGFDGTSTATAFSTTPGVCSFRQPQFCDRVRNIFNVAGVKRNTPRAGGNYRFGRRTFYWHSGSEVVLDYNRRNVLGFSLDWAEDVTKSNWSIESTWINNVVLADNSQEDGLTSVDEFNLTVSVDRPTFINFLNANRTFLINSQWFFQYRAGYHQGITAPGPWNVLFTFSVQTGYAQDRLLPRFTAVYDVRTESGAFLPSIEYRFTAELSLTLGMNIFWGRAQLKPMPLREIGVTQNRGGMEAYRDQVENGLSVVRDRDEVFFRLRYTF